MSAAALASESPVSLYSHAEALRLARKPIARMVDDNICERIAAVSYQDGRLAAGANVALFRSNNRREPFLHVTAREDGVTIVRFPAIPGEVIYGRGYVIDPETDQIYYGRAGKTVCERAGKVEIGELSNANEIDGDSADESKRDEDRPDDANPG